MFNVLLAFVNTYHINEMIIFLYYGYSNNMKILLSILLFLVNILHTTFLPTFKIQKISFYILILTCVSIQPVNNNNNKKKMFEYN